MADRNKLAHRIVERATEPDTPETPAHVNGRRGGQKGGKARADKLTATERSEIARKAARTCWANR